MLFDDNKNCLKRRRTSSMPPHMKPKGTLLYQPRSDRGAAPATSGQVLLLLEGRAHAYVFASKGCKKWDTCAPEGVLEALGGKLTDIHGNHYSYAKDAQYPDAQGIFATAKGVDHKSLVSKLPQELRDAFPY